MKSIELPSGVSVVSSFGKRQREKVDYKKVMEAAQVLNEEKAKRRILQPSADITIATNDPVALFLHGDQHIGNKAVNYAELLRQTETIKDTKGAFLSMTGDILDNAFIFRGGGYDDTLSYDMQAEASIGMVKDLDETGKVLWHTQGNHELFQDNLYPAYWGDVNFPVIGPNHGTVNLKVGNVSHDIFSFHKLSMGSSTMSPLLRCQRAIEYYDSDADIVVAGHTHRKVVGQYKLGIDKHQKLRTMIETGTFKPDETWQREQGNLRMAQFDYGGAGVILFPDKKEVMPFYDFDTGVEMLNGLTGLRSVLSATTSNILRGGS